MSRLELCNFYVFQWFFFRLARITDSDTGETVGWGLLRWVYPMTGWSSPYRWLKPVWPARNIKDSEGEP